MEITFTKPKFEPRFVATVYTTDKQPDIYRVNIGKEATDTGMDNDENPWECTDQNGNIHSRFFDMTKFLGDDPTINSYEPYKSIIRFDIGQKTNLKFVNTMGNLNLASILNKKGFETIARISNSSAKTDIERFLYPVKEKALELILDLNDKGEKYLVFSNSFYGYSSSYTFMRKG